MNKGKGFFGFNGAKIALLDKDGNAIEWHDLELSTVRFERDDDAVEAFFAAPVSGRIEIVIDEQQSRNLWALLSGRWFSLWDKIARVLGNRQN